MAVEELFVRAVEGGTFLKNESMSKHCSFKTGGVAEFFIAPSSINALVDVIKLAKESHVPYIVIGNGSNLLVSDKGVRGAVIHIGERLSGISINGNEITVQAGAVLSKVANFAMENSLSGFEFAAGIPGSFGGAVFMNAGAYGGEIKNVLKSVKFLTPNLTIEELPVNALNLGYRTSIFEENGCVILEGVLSLGNGNVEAIRALMADFNSRRRDKQPINLPSAGSTFKRPDGYFAGQLIEESGLKGYTIGGAQVSTKHAGFVVNIGGATTADILAVIEQCKKVVYNNHGVTLQCEVKLVGEF